MILCCGESLIDMIPEQTSKGTSGFVPYPGGAIFNTAIGIGRLECPVGLMSGISTDIFGQQLMAELSASNVDTSNVILSDRPTTLAFVQLTDGQASYLFYDENSAGRMIAVKDMPHELKSITAFLFGGISLHCDPGAEAYVRFAETHANDAVVMVDPNIRPSFISNEILFRDHMERMLRLADIVKVSNEDLNWFFPGSENVETKIAKLRKLGPTIVILTSGSSGVKAWKPEEDPIFVDSLKVDVVDTVGAGDSFNAGFLTSLSKAGLLNKPTIRLILESDIVAALNFGVRTAAKTVGRAGANPPWIDEL
jgi:fructokinase